MLRIFFSPSFWATAHAIPYEDRLVAIDAYGFMEVAHLVIFSTRKRSLYFVVMSNLEFRYRFVVPTGDR